MSKLLDNISDSLIILSKETKNSEVIKNELRETLRDYDSFEKKLNEIPFQKYQAWIPNNAGILNWVRIGTEYEAKQRYLFKKGSFKKGSFEDNQSNIIESIEIIDTDVGIDDSLLKNKSLYPIFLSEIYFKNEIDSKLVDVISGSGHLVNNGKYIGESVLAFFEKETYLELKNLNINVIQSYRPKWLDGKELDIYLPDYNLAIEYNGLTYHHSSKGLSKFLDNTYVNPKFHLNKFNKCKENDIKLIHIFEHENFDNWLKQIQNYLENQNNYDISFNNILRNIVLHNRKYIIYGESYIIPSNIV